MSRKKYKFNLSKPIFVRRMVPRQFERGIKVWQTSEDRAFWTNPESSLFWMTGLNFGRNYCVMSYLDGLVAAGHDVQIYDTHFGYKTRKHINHGGIAPAYWLLGYLAGRKEQGVFRDWIMQFHLSCRATIVLAAARYYMSHLGEGYQSRDKITVPLEVLLFAR